MKKKILYTLIVIIIAAIIAVIFSLELVLVYIGWRWHGISFSASSNTVSTQQNTAAVAPKVDLTVYPTSTLPPDYSPSFVDWFVFGANKIYEFTDQEVSDKVPEGQVKSLTLTSGSPDYIKVMLISTLTTQDWYVMENETARLLVSDATKPILLTLFDADKKWIIDISPDQQFANILFAWYIIPDNRYKSDKYPLAFWLTYNIANADGFTQVLTLFKTESDGSLRVIKTFEGRNGFASLDGDIIWVGEATTTDPSNGVLGYEKTHITKYSASTFKQISEQTVPNVYWSDAWLKWN